MIHLLMVLLASAPLAQDASETRPANDEKAVELFKKAAAAQTADGKAIPIRDFQADELAVTFHERDEKTGEMSRKSAAVTQLYGDRGDRTPLFRRRLAEQLSGTVTQQGYDGEIYWQKLGDSPARELKGRDSQQEKKRVMNEMRRTKEFLRFLFLANLEGPGVTLRYLGPRKIRANERDRDVEAIVREKPGEGPIELYIGEAKGRTVLYGLSRKLDSGVIEQVAFALHEPVEAGGKTALVPLVAEYREDGVLTFEAAAARPTHIKLNSGIDPAQFAMPR